MKKLWETASGPGGPASGPGGPTPGLDPLAQAYTVGRDPELDSRLLPYEVYGSLAHAAGLVRIGVLAPAEFGAIRTALDELLAQAGAFRIKPEQEDIHTAVEHYLTAALGDAGKKIHAGRSRNDQVQVDLRLFLKDKLLELHAQTCRAAGAWTEFGRKHADVLAPGYTHLQRAMPTTLGHWAASHAEALVEGATGLKAAYFEADACPLGSAAGYGAGLPLDRGYVAGLLGFARVQRNTLRVQSSRARIEAAAVSALALLARDLGVLAWDLSLYLTAEFGFLKLDPSFCTGSSLMPQKRNPDVVELTRARAALFPGWLNQLLCLGQLPSGYHRDYQLAKGPLFAAVDAAGEMLDVVGRLPGKLEVRPEACRAALTEETLATERALALVREGMPFREAYGQVAAKARGADHTAARDVKLPDYAGAPGNPGFDALADDLRVAAEWSLGERAKLKGAWDALLAPGFELG